MSAWWWLPPVGLLAMRSEALCWSAGVCMHMGTMASNGLRIIPSRAMSFGFFPTVLLSRRLHVREEFVGSRYGVGDLVFFGQTATSDQIYSLEAARWPRTKRFRA